MLKKKKRNFSDFELTLLVLPGLIYYIIWHYLPLFGIVLGFKKYNYRLGIWGSPWVGFKNFKFFFTSQDAWRTTRNTLGYNILFIVIGVAAAVIIALLLYEIKERYLLKIFQTTMAFPNFLSWVIVSYIVYIFLNPEFGLLNQFLINVFGEEAGVAWYSELTPWPYIFVISNLWKHVGMDSIIYYAALMSIDKSLFEAAEIDHANKFQKILYISVPHLVPTVIILVILKIGNIFRGDFGLFYQLPRNLGNLYPVTDVIDTYIFRGIRGGYMEASTAVGFFQSVVGFILVILTNAIVRKIDPDSALF